MSYREYLPSPELSPYVSCYWSRDGSEAEPSRVLPDGAVDFLFDVATGGAFVVGTMTRPVLVTAASSYVAVRFRPAGVRAFLSLPVQELTDRREELAPLVPRAGEWLERLALAPGPSARARTLEGLLRGALGTHPGPDQRVVTAVRELERSRGALAVGSLSRDIGVSRQHLSRLFEREVGVGVKTFARVVRMQSVVARVARASTRPAWAELALDVGFFDQAHFVNDFRALTGLTPERYFKGFHFSNTGSGPIG